MGNYLLPFLEVTDFTVEVEGFGNKVLYGLEMLLIGMVIVFSVLALLWITLEISGRAFQKLSAPKNPAAEKSEPTVAPELQTTDETELIAVLTAAIAAMESAPAARFRVVSFKRK